MTKATNNTSICAQDDIGLKMNTFYNVDSMSHDGMEKIKTKSIDLILTDLPFGTTKNKWDIIIPLNDYIEIEINNKLIQMQYDEYLLHCYKNHIKLNIAENDWKKLHKKGLWHSYNRILKDDGVILLFAQKPFDAMLQNSNKQDFRYEWIWEKTHPSGHMNAKKMPMKAHENILVFYKSLPTYNPQKTSGHERKTSTADRAKLPSTNYGKQFSVTSYDSTERYPRSVIKIAHDKQFLQLVPTQKPVELYEYLIRTYSNKHSIVLDHCSGSGTLAVACENVGDRNFICMEMDKDHGYFEDSVDRLNIHRILRTVVKEAIVTSSTPKIKDIVKISLADERILSLSNYRRGDEIIKRIKKNIENIVDVYKRSEHIEIKENGCIAWMSDKTNA
ncbi:site-specific DNA-methyltransferase [Sulfuricurvum sp.]|uniref:DNA-methyltransferase n=1 Tax=Sulfuricurvum sp. TaxID=2025608 RepID=UPI00286E6452|nr:site-specific DNA-methyltransferase [Sulfuricurvum sp.]